MGIKMSVRAMACRFGENRAKSYLMHAGGSFSLGDNDSMRNDYHFVLQIEISSVIWLYNTGELDGSVWKVKEQVLLISLDVFLALE